MREGGEVMRAGQSLAWRMSLFETESFRACELGAGDVPGLQQFFEVNPEFFLNVYGQAPTGNEAQEEFDDAPPDGMAFTRKWVLGMVDGDGAIMGMANVCSNLVVERVWHLGLFVVASAWHGTGRSRAIYEKLEEWISSQGATWARLGVVKGNAKAERFWEKLGFTEVRERGPFPMGTRRNVVRVLVKPLAGGTLADYLALVMRDRPGEP